ncbi:MAG: transcriptional regulator [Herminiimonas sp.]|nr:transcriptional regulator [Herminiimonas sp.]
MRRLPPLNAVRAFEAAARHGSFTKAGHELSVTHGAISRQVSLLERWLGVGLFDRAGSRLVLSESGRQFFNEASAALDRLALATFQFSHNTDLAQLIVSAPPTFTLRWLIPRLSSFQRRHLGIKVHLTTSIAPIDFSKEQYHIAIRGATQQIAGVSSRSFMTETIIPICHPDLIEKKPLTHPGDLANHTLLSYSTEPYSWQDWFNVLAIPEVKPVATLNLEQMYFALQAALEGLGIALIPYFLVADDIAAGRLCAPLGSMGALTRRYYVNLKSDAGPNPTQEAFCNWLQQEGEETMKLCDQLMAS